VLAAARRGASSIVPDPEVASTPRCDVDIVVTEHGAADLRGLDDAERAAALVEVAAPEHRRQLADASRSRSPHGH
jgi:acyl-CoA hydrolase